MEKRYRIYALCCIAILIVIFILSNQKGAESYTLSNDIEETLDSTFIGNAIDQLGLSFRNAAHIFLYFLLGLFSALSVLDFFKLAGKYMIYYLTVVYSLIFCFLAAAFDEWHQTFIAGRNGCVHDVFIDAIGFGLGILVICILHFIYTRIYENVRDVKK